jgi:hypothetical protein
MINSFQVGHGAPAVTRGAVVMRNKETHRRGRLAVYAYWTIEPYPQLLRTEIVNGDLSVCGLSLSMDELEWLSGTLNQIHCDDVNQRGTKFGGTQPRTLQTGIRGHPAANTAYSAYRIVKTYEVKT